MGFLDALKRTFSEEPPPPVVGPGFTPATPTDDAAEMLAPEPPLDPAATAEPAPAEIEMEAQFFGIRYVDSAGKVTIRRLTARRITTNAAGERLLYARCHERKATRCFKLARITHIVSTDGETSDPVLFFADFGLTAADFASAPAPTANDRQPRAADDPDRATFNLARVGARLLTALSRSDGFMHPEETPLIARYMADFCRENGRPWTEADDRKALAFVERLYPTADQIDRAIERLGEQSRADVRLWCVYAQALIEADGVLHPAEEALLAEIHTALG